MLMLSKLRVRGFRGFLNDEELSLDGPVTLLFGENRCGKSSTLNAIEWGLFGSACSGQQTKIRERVDWIVANLKADEVAVDLEMKCRDGRWFVRRSRASQARKKSQRECLQLTTPDGERVEGVEAEHRLAQLLRSSFRDFATTVYQHQETIRAIVTQEPRERNDAIDRLLGLSDCRNLLGALHQVNAKGWQKKLAERVAGLEQGVQVVLRTREKDLEDLRRQAIDAGVPRTKLRAPDALVLASSLQQQLADFAAGADLQPPSLPSLKDWTALPSFLKAAKAAITRLRGAIPGVEEHQQLLDRRGEIVDLKAEFEGAKTTSDNIGADVRNLEKEHGPLKKVAERIIRINDEIKAEKDRLGGTERRANLIADAIDFLEAEAQKVQLSGLCPVCGNEAPDLVQQLRLQWEGRLQGQAGKGRDKIKSLKEEVAELEKVADGHESCNKKMKAVAAKIEACRKTAGKLLGREFTVQDDLPALLNSEVGKITRRLGKLSGTVQARQDRLDEIEGDLDRVRLVHSVLQTEQKKEIIEQIQGSPEYQNLEALRDRAADFVDDLGAIQEAIGKVATEESGEKLAAAEAAIDDYFRRLTRNPAIRSITLQRSEGPRTQRNDYTVTDQDGKDLTPILSHLPFAHPYSRY
jgi:DNA repair exonuclease SbcCD ATPase subunit